MQLNSWGNYPKINSNIKSLESKVDLRDYLKKIDEFIPYGNGRSYGDSALYKNILYCKPYNYFLDFDENNGILHCQSGVMLGEIVEFFLPRGWFLEVTPGTKLITVGGAIAADVHGKNHHKQGTFSKSVLEFNLMLPNGEIVNVKKNDELFLATCGGMGLTGVILDVKLKLKKVKSAYVNQTTIKTKNLAQTFEAFERYKDYNYSVAWIDCLNQKNIGKCLLMVGDFCDDSDFEVQNKRGVNIPLYFPNFTLNKWSIKVFNYLYYSRVKDSVVKNRVDFNSFFYPLDSIDNWNRIYGKNGFLQYQFIVPKQKSFDALEEILSKIAKNKMGSFLAVLKLYGKENENYLSFPIEGYSLALDFKIEPRLFDFLDELDKIVVKYGGRIYLAKDSRVKRDIFESGYDKIDIFRKIRKSYEMDKKFNSLQSKRLYL